MAQALTTRTVETVKPGDTRCEIPDAHMPGLYLVVQPSGAKSWAVRYRHHGRPRKHTVGAYPAIDLKTARALGAKALRAAAEGRDPGQEKAEARASQANSVESVAAGPRAALPELPPALADRDQGPAAPVCAAALARPPGRKHYPA